MARVRVGPGTVVGARSIVDSGSVVGSHGALGDGVRIGPGVAVAAFRPIGTPAFLGDHAEGRVGCRWSGGDYSSQRRMATAMPAMAMP